MKEWFLIYFILLLLQKYDEAPFYQGVILLDFSLQDHSRNQPKKGSISLTLHFDVFLDHRFQYLLMNSREASKRLLFAVFCRELSYKQLTLIRTLQKVLTKTYLCYSKGCRKTAAATP